MGYGAREYVPAVDGGSVTLTIDASIQSFAEKAAREAMAVNNAKSVRVAGDAAADRRDTRPRL